MATGGGVTQPTVLCAIDRGVAVVTLNRPERLNAFIGEMQLELRATLERIDADESVRCLVITGAGRGFCAGQDLADPSILPGSPEGGAGEAIERFYNPLVRWLTNARMPTIAAVNGVAAGAGANLALCCDLVFAARSAKFIQSFGKLGLVPDTGGTYWLQHLVGRARALGLSLLCDAVTAETAAGWGMIWSVVDDPELMTTVMAVAEHLATQPTAGLRRIRMAIDAASSNTLEQQLSLEQQLQLEAGNSDDYLEGIRAFVEKRTPRFTGR
jgi:2-(1,2-epoxy-1,2-dihydrophenyl)acetyl-CoA isomerase